MRTVFDPVDYFSSSLCPHLSNKRKGMCGQLEGRNQERSKTLSFSLTFGTVINELHHDRLFKREKPLAIKELIFTVPKKKRKDSTVMRRKRSTIDRLSDHAIVIKFSFVWDRAVRPGWHFIFKIHFLSSLERDKWKKIRIENEGHYARSFSFS